MLFELLILKLKSTDVLVHVLVFKSAKIRFGTIFELAQMKYDSQKFHSFYSRRNPFLSFLLLFSIVKD
jgi:hypothetical protein